MAGKGFKYQQKMSVDASSGLRRGRIRPHITAARTQPTETLSIYKSGSSSEEDDEVGGIKRRAPLAISDDLELPMATKEADDVSNSARTHTANGFDT